MGSLFLFQALRPGASLFNHLSVNFGVPYFAMTAGLNVLISILIAGRLLMYRRQLNRLFGHDYAAAAPYVSAAALIIESSFIYAVNSICFVIPYGLESHVANIFLPLQALAPVRHLCPCYVDLLTYVSKGVSSNAHHATCSIPPSLGYQDIVSTHVQPSVPKQVSSDFSRPRKVPLAR